MSRTLEGKVALVTGGSRGIGRSIAVMLASEGAKVFVNYSSNSEAAEESRKLCEEVGGNAEIIGFNVENREAVDEAISQIKESAGSLDILVNNAGISRDGLFVRMKDEDWNQTIAVNLSGAFYCSRAAAKIMMKARSGRIVNISSVVGEMGNLGQVPYAASKAGLLGFTKALARELSSRGITVNAVTPGFIETDMTADIDEKMREEHLKLIPLGHYGKPDDIASLVAYLAGDSASYITGQVIGVNGGMHM